MKLWDIQTGKCLFTWEFPTAVKRVAFSEDDTLIACITEQRMGYSGAIRIFEINRSGQGTDRMCQTTWFSGRKLMPFLFSNSRVLGTHFYLPPNRLKSHRGYLRTQQ